MIVKVFSDKAKSLLDLFKNCNSINYEVVNEHLKDFKTDDLKEFYAVLSFALQHSEVNVEV